MARTIIHIGDESTVAFSNLIVERAREQTKGDMGDAITWVISEWPGPTHSMLKSWLHSE